MDASGHSDSATDDAASRELKRLLEPVTAQLPNIASVPHMPEQGIARMATLMRQARCYQEFGTGGTTMMARQLGVQQVVAVESDWLWMEALRLKLAADSALPTGMHLLHIDIGPTGAWGFPPTDARWKQFRDYPLAPWEHCRAHGLVPDLVLIDGRFRCACFLATCLMAAPGTRVLFDDYYDRPDYHCVEQFLKPQGAVDRMAEFVVSESLASQDLWLALTRALSDAR